MSPIKFIAVIIQFILYSSCGEENRTVVISKQQEKRLLDSLQCSAVLAAFTENTGCSWILGCNSGSQLIKITWHPSYPLFVDSITEKSRNRYASLHYNYEYEIRDKEVAVIYIRKIIHPSSNWQGQTPGEEFLTCSFKRTDGMK